MSNKTQQNYSVLKDLHLNTSNERTTLMIRRNQRHVSSAPAHVYRYRKLNCTSWERRISHIHLKGKSTNTNKTNLIMLWRQRGQRRQKYDHAQSNIIGRIKN
jgi:hypothetical protein